MANHSFDPTIKRRVWHHGTTDPQPAGGDLSEFPISDGHAMQSARISAMSLDRNTLSIVTDRGSGWFRRWDRYSYAMYHRLSPIHPWQRGVWDAPALVLGNDPIRHYAAATIH